MRMSPVEARHGEPMSDYLQDFVDSGEESPPGWFARPEWSWDEVVRQVNGWSRGDFLQPGWVPCTTLLLEKQGRVLGLSLIHI